MKTGRRRYLVTGALGAIGAWTTKTLLDRGYQVIAFDVGDSLHRLELALEPDSDDGRLRNVQGDITSLDELGSVLTGNAVTNVIHLAALQIPSVRERPALGALVNVVGTVNVFEAVRRAGLDGPLVYASSIAALGPAGGGDVPATLYGVFKRANEATAIRYFEDYGVSSVGLRPHTVYGPGRDQGLTSAPTFAMLAAAAGRPYEIPFGGRLQFQYLPDVAEAFVRASELEYRGGSVHNLDGPVATVEDLIDLIETAAEIERGTITSRGEPLPFPSAVDGASFVDLLGGSVNRPLADGVSAAISRFRELLERGHVPAPG